MNNERGGILSKLFILPAVIVLMAVVFVLGYYLGRHQNDSDVSDTGLPPLPDIVSENLPKPEDFTFYRTLTAKEDKTVSINLRPKHASGEGASERKQTDNPVKESAPQASKEKAAVLRAEGKTAAEKPSGKADVRKTPEQQKIRTEQTASSKQRYSVQVSSHQEKQAADLEVKKMKRQGFAAFVASSELPGRGTWYRVRIGSFRDRAAAERLQKDVRARAGVSSIVVAE